LRYIDKLQTLPDDDPKNALYLGTAIHTAIEKGADEAVKQYFDNFPICGEQHFIQEYIIRELSKKIVVPDGKFEVKIDHPDFQGFIDLLVPIKEELRGKNHICDECKEFKGCSYSYGGYCPSGHFEVDSQDTFDIYDFKYSNNVEHYMESEQLHLYKYFYELTTGNKIRNMYFLFIPKTGIRQRKSETYIQFMKRLQGELDKIEPFLEYVEYNPNKVINYLIDVKHTVEAVEHPKCETHLCNWCEYKDYCQKGYDFMLLPSIENVPVSMGQHKKIWLYGQPFSGKTHLASEAPAPVLELNTDGNVKHYTMPRLTIKDSVTGSERNPVKKFGWETFVQAINELEAGSEFKTIVVDLLDDVYDSCRAYVCDKKSWEHESDDSFKAYDIVRNEFLRTMKRLTNLPYNIILISHEDTSTDITKRGGDKVTKIKPNIPEKVAVKLAGMVDIVIRCEKDHDEYIISTKTNNVVFGGGRLGITKAVELKNSWESIDELYSMNKVSKEDIAPVTSENTASEVASEDTTTENVVVEDNAPKTRRRKRGE
jgi:hypothetical protein